MITFQKIPPERVEFLPELALKYLETAIKRTPASASRLDITLELAKRGNGNIYLICSDYILTGICYLIACDTTEGKVVCPCLVGGDNMRHWLDDFHKFVYEFAQSINAHKVRWIGRKGWAKAFPKSQVIGYIFEHKLTPFREGH